MFDCKYNIYDNLEYCYFKTGCTLVTIIDAGHTLSDDEVRKYFDIDEDHRHWERAHRPSRVKRYVFDKCIIPATNRFRLETCYE